MLGVSEPSAKKAKYDKQKNYNEKRKEKPRKPQFNFGEEEGMQATSARFVKLRNMANARSGRTNADSFQVLMDQYERKTVEESPKTMLLSRRTLLSLSSSFMLKGR